MVEDQVLVCVEGLRETPVGDEVSLRLSVGVSVALAGERVKESEGVGVGVGVLLAPSDFEKLSVPERVPVGEGDGGEGVWLRLLEALPVVVGLLV